MFKKGERLSEECIRKGVETRMRNGSYTAWNKGIPRTEETKIKISKVKKGKYVGTKNPFYGRKHTEETKEKIRKSRGKYIGINHPLFGKHHSRKAKIKMRIAKIGKILSKETRLKLSESHKGNKCHFWKGGIARLPYPYGFSNELKTKIRKRDNYQCQNKECNMTEEEHLIVYGRVLDVHHIDYNKQNIQENNLLSLCRQCNVRVNFNRDYWKNTLGEVQNAVNGA